MNPGRKARRAADFPESAGASAGRCATLAMASLAVGEPATAQAQTRPDRLYLSSSGRVVSLLPGALAHNLL
jgi:hypothetical protein